MKRYEYTVIKSNDINNLQRLGGEGWLIVAVTGKEIYLMREVKNV